MIDTAHLELEHDPWAALSPARQAAAGGGRRVWGRRSGAKRVFSLCVCLILVGTRGIA